MRKNEGGFSLVQVVIAAGLMGMLSLGIMQLAKNSSDIQKKMAKASDMEDLVRLYKRNLLGSRCVSALGISSPLANITTPQKINLTSFKDTYNSTKVIFDSSSSSNKFGKVSVKEVYIEVPAGAESKAHSANTQRSADLTLNISYEYNKTATAVKKIPLLVEFDTTVSSGSNIVSCSLDYFAGDLEKEALCEAMGGTLPDPDSTCQIPPSAVEILGGYP